MDFKIRSATGLLRDRNEAARGGTRRETWNDIERPKTSSGNSHPMEFFHSRIGNTARNKKGEPSSVTKGISSYYFTLSGAIAKAES